MSVRRWRVYPSSKDAEVEHEKRLVKSGGKVA
jgi:hypothetical protein